MATLSVWRFVTPEGADADVETLQSMEKQGLITVHDAVDRVVADLRAQADDPPAPRPHR